MSFKVYYATFSKFFKRYPHCKVASLNHGFKMVLYISLYKYAPLVSKDFEASDTVIVIKSGWVARLGKHDHSAA